MDWSDVQTILGSLPSTYLRVGSNFNAHQNSVTAGVSRFSSFFDSIIAQTSFSTAGGKWADVWGGLLGVSRLSGESTETYKNRISGTILSWRGTIPGIETFVNSILGISSSVNETIAQNGFGWNLSLSSGTTLTSAQISSLISSLAFVRPAGVPYSIKEVTSGLYLGTGNFLSGTEFPGSWLSPQVTSSYFSVPSTTNNNVCNLPTTWLTDTTLNG